MERNAEMFVQGRCAQMCPLKELLMREREGILHPLEQKNGVGNRFCRRPPADPKRTIKQFSRPAAGQESPKPCDVRPPEVLRETVCYLFNEILVFKDMDWIKVYDFIFDRLRAVRQDMVVQDLGSHDCIPLLEAIIRFHVYAAYRLCEEPIAKYDPFINQSHLLECLKRLLVMYEADENRDVVHIHRNEMEALYLLLNLGDTKVLHRAIQIDQRRRNSIFNLAMTMSLGFWSGNYVRVCRIMAKLPLLLAAIASLHLPQIRRHALKVMSIAYSSKYGYFPIKTLRSMLLFENDKDVLNECIHYNIQQEDASTIIFCKATFEMTAKLISPRHTTFVDQLLLACSNIPQVLLGLT